MNIFISWSGVRSKYIAESFREWLPCVIQSLRPFISTQDITKGKRGVVVISDQLATANVGLICLTPENIESPWVLFEADALSKETSAIVCTLLFDLTPSAVPPPLGQFQHTVLERAELKKLTEAINIELGEARLDKYLLDEAFDTWWPKLEKRLKAVPKKPAEEKVPKERSEESKMDELLELVRKLGVRTPRPIALREPVLYEAAPRVRPSKGELRIRDLNALLREVSTDGSVSTTLMPPQVLSSLLYDEYITFDVNGKLVLTELGKAHAARHDEFVYSIKQL